MSDEGLTEKMLALAATHPRGDELRAKSEALTKAIATGDARKLLVAWARARLLWVECTGEALV